MKELLSGILLKATEAYFVIDSMYENAFPDLVGNSEGHNSEDLTP